MDNFNSRLSVQDDKATVAQFWKDSVSVSNDLVGLSVEDVFLLVTAAETNDELVATCTLKPDPAKDGFAKWKVAMATDHSSADLFKHSIKQSVESAKGKGYQGLSVIVTGHEDNSPEKRAVYRENGFEYAGVEEGLHVWRRSL